MPFLYTIYADSPYLQDVQKVMDEVYSTITPENIASAGVKLATSLVILFLAYLIARLFRMLYNFIILNTVVKSGGDPTNYQFLSHSIAGIIYMLGLILAIYTIPSLRSLSGSLIAGAGILAAIIGFASQAAFSNVVGGVFIIIFQPFRVNNRLLVGTGADAPFGVVEDITLRHTVLRSPENKRIVIPNSIISSQVILNYDMLEPNVCETLDFNIGFNVKIDDAKNVISKIVAQHPNYLDTRTTEQIEAGDNLVDVRTVAIDTYSIRLRVWIWAVSEKIYATKCDLIQQIKEAFDANNIPLALPYQQIQLQPPPKQAANTLPNTMHHNLPH